MYKDYQKSFKENFNSLSMKYGEYPVFLDFVKMCAISLYNSFAKNKKMEEMYLNAINSYDKEDQNLFPKMFGDLVMMYQTVDDIIDILGPIYEHEGLSNVHIGQFFTPSHVAEIMSKISLNDEKENFKKLIEDKGFITMCEPTCGSGVMIIAFAKVLKSENINYQKDLLVIANDISDVCAYMTYIQLSLYGIPAIVYCGNALTNDISFKMETPLYFLQYWKFQNAFVEDLETRTNSNQNEIIVEEKIQNKFKEVMVKGNCQISLF